MACQVRVHGKASLCGLPQTQASSVWACWTFWHWWLPQRVCMCVWNVPTFVLLGPVMVQHETWPVKSFMVNTMESSQSSVLYVVHLIIFIVIQKIKIWNWTTLAVLLPVKQNLMDIYPCWIETTANGKVQADDETSHIWKYGFIKIMTLWNYGLNSPMNIYYLLDYRIFKYIWSPVLKQEVRTNKVIVVNAILITEYTSAGEFVWLLIWWIHSF